MEINAAAQAVAQQSVGTTSVDVSASVPAGTQQNAGGSAFTPSSPLTTRLVNQITSSHSLSGVEKVGLIKTVTLIDRLKATDTLRTKLLKDVAAVTSFLERTAQVRQQRTQQVKFTRKDAVEVFNKVAQQVKQQAPSNVELRGAVTVSLERVVQEAREVSAVEAVARGEQFVPQVLGDGNGNEVEVIVEGIGSSENAEPIDLPLPGGNVETVVEGVGAGSVEPGVEVSIPGSASSSAEGVELGEAQLLDELV